MATEKGYSTLQGIREVQDRAGWTDTTLMHLLMEFIAHHGLSKRAARFLEDQATNDELLARPEHCECPVGHKLHEPGRPCAYVALGQERCRHGVLVAYHCDDCKTETEGVTP